MRNKIKLVTEVTDTSVIIRYQLGNWTMVLAIKPHDRYEWTLSTSVKLPKYIHEELLANSAHYVPNHLSPSLQVSQPPTKTEVMDKYKEIKAIADKQVAKYRVARLQKQMDKQMGLHIQSMAKDHVQSHDDLPPVSEEDLSSGQADEVSVQAPRPPLGLKVLGKIDLNKVLNT